ncbi:MAG: transglutaminase, partial [Ramlibacter sp.]|nr:transglutaminase [Ramlibacter sp.]
MLVQSDEHFPLLEAATSLAQDEYPDLDLQLVLGDVDQLLARLKRRIPTDAAEAEIAEEKLVQRAQPLQRRGVGGNAALQARQQLVDVAQHQLQVEVRVFVLRKARRRF